MGQSSAGRTLKNGNGNVHVHPDTHQARFNPNLFMANMIFPMSLLIMESFKRREFALLNISILKASAAACYSCMLGLRTPYRTCP